MPSTSILKWTSSYRVTTSSPFTSRNKRKTLSLSSSQSSCSETPVTSSGIINSQDIRPEEDQITTEMTRLEVDSSSSRSSSRSSNSSWWSFLYPSNTRMYFVCKYQEYKRNKKENNKRKVTERELSHLNHKIVSNANVTSSSTISGHNAIFSCCMFVNPYDCGNSRMQ